MEYINIAEILKDCPAGTKLYSPAFGEMKFVGIEMVTNRILCETALEDTREFDENGTFYDGGECMLFPSKDCRDWSKFKKPVVPPFEVKKEKGIEYHIITDYGAVLPRKDDHTIADVQRFCFGNYFNTEEQAEYAAQKVKELLLSLRKEVKGE